MFAFLLVSYQALLSQTIRINEVQASNARFFDEDGDTPDWIEIWNGTSETADLNGWSMSDDIDDPIKWRFPDIGLASDEYLLLWASDKDRQAIMTPRTLIDWRDDWQYIIPDQNTSLSWINQGFDASDWSVGPSGFGYGDGDDETQIPSGTTAIFARKIFTISNRDQINELLLDIDYDDGFVAYLNGVEIARANIDGNPPSYNARTNTDSEARMINNQAPLRFDISDAIDLLKTGENILAIQAHNISSNSSDFSLIPMLSAFYSGTTTDGIEPPELLGLRSSRLHTNFKLSSSGEAIYLFDGDSQLVDSLAYTNLPSSVSYGRGTDTLVYFDEPTPGTANSDRYFVGLVDEKITFSDPGGKVTSLDLMLSGVDSPYEIRYTIDASVPTEQSPLYDNEAIRIDENQVVRARVFRDDYLPSPTQSHTYLIGVSHSLPIINLVTEASNFYDENTGIYVFGNNAAPNYPYFGANFWQDWERPVHFSLIESDRPVLAFDAGVKIFGGWSRALEQRSLSIFARGAYGLSEIDYPLFPNLPYDKFQSIVLRNSGNDWRNTNLRDAALTGIMEGSGLDIQAYQPVVSYLNGEYFGIYNMREKINEHFLASKHGIDINAVDILEFEGNVIHGDNQEYLDLMNFIELNDLSESENYEYVSSLIDIDNYIMYYVAQLYFNNTDWPGNNIKYWKADGGKWRWILFDTDFGFGAWSTQDYRNNTIDFALQPNGPDWPNPPWSTFLFRNMTKNQAFRNAFINQYADELNSRFLSANVNSQINKKANRIASEISRHFERWGGNVNNWTGNIQYLYTFANQRPAQVKTHILSTFDLPDFHRISLAVDDTQRGYLQLNSLKIESKNWSGDYFESVPIKLTAVPKPGYEFSHWEGASNSTARELTIDMVENQSFTAVFNPSTAPFTQVIINEINYKSADDFDTGDWIELYNNGNEAADISSWIIKDSDDTNCFSLPENTILDADEYLVICRKIDDFSMLHPEVDRVMGELDFGLSSNGDAVRVFDADSVLIDEVIYSSDLPWPTMANGEGYTLELKEPILDNSIPANWAPIHIHGSPGETNVKTVNTNEISDLTDITIYSNPTSSNFTLSIGSQKTLDISISIYDQKARLIKNLDQLQLRNGTVRRSYDISEMPAGLYYLIVNDTEGRRNVLKLSKI